MQYGIWKKLKKASVNFFYNAIDFLGFFSNIFTHHQDIERARKAYLNIVTDIDKQIGFYNRAIKDNERKGKPTDKLKKELIAIRKERADIETSLLDLTIKDNHPFLKSFRFSCILISIGICLYLVHTLYNNKQTDDSLTVAYIALLISMLQLLFS